ncbi:gustatory and pheromone receptor 39a-like [Drosophila ficusphila]|uniref:gustatory and pheromone receptor 39a-like n=1 Tax=Drosophila ficusphila TaxID=30025 RepID=UPI0007E8A886|nr:gustatory and pheromone receptor 39a-like [Drosophila ficusphila]
MNPKLLSILRYQRYLGLTDLDFFDSLMLYRLHSTWLSIATQLLVVGLFLSALVATLAESLYYMDTQSQTGNTFDNAVMLATAASQLLANLWFRSQQEAQVALLQRLSQLARRFQFQFMPQTRCLDRVWMAVCLFYGAMVAGFSPHWLTGMQLSHAITLLGFAARCIIANFQITCYCGMVLVLQGLLRAQVEQLEGLLSSASISTADLAGCLRAHDEILLLGQAELVAVYGGVLLFLSVYQAMQCVLILYISNLEGFKSINEMFFILGWMAPMVFYLVLPLVVNDVLNQVSLR